MANGENVVKLKELNKKVREWVTLYRDSGGRKKLPQATVTFFEEIKAAILPQAQKALKKQAAAAREQGPAKQGAVAKAPVQKVATAKKLSGSVGLKCDNKQEDVKLVQELLNKNGASLTVDGAYGNNTLTAIKAYQQKTFGWADGAISADGETATALLGGSTATTTPETPTATPTSTTTDEPVEISGTGPSSSSFKFSEFVSKNDPVYKQHNGDPVKIVPQELWPNIQKLMKQLEVIRGALGVAMNINSGYRSPVHNANVGGASKSQHKLGTASDISCSLPPQKVHAIIAGLINAGQISQGGLGLYNSFVHYDIRGTAARWNESSSGYLTPVVPNAQPVDTNTDTNTDTNSGGVDNTTDQPQANKSLTAAVGEGSSPNNEADVKLVQELLNDNGASLTEDGKYGKNTLTAIKAYQQKTFGWADGIIGPDGDTIKALLGGTTAPVDTPTATPTSTTTDEPVEISGTGPSSSSFKFSEFVSKNDPVYKQHNGDPVKIVPQELWPNIQKLMKQLEVIRGALGVAMNINSGYRSPVHNANVGGASKSQHKLGTASDISCSLPPQKVHAIIAGLINAGKISQGGLGLYNSFVHYDIRGTAARWNESSSGYLTPVVPS